jgi:hypothetical protein
MTKADWFLYVSCILIVAGVACYDWRAGMIVGGALSGVCGILLAMR